MGSLFENNVFEFGFMHGQRVADFGAGAGHYTLPLSRAVGSEGRVVALDIDEVSLVRLKNLARQAGLNNLEIMVGDIEKTEGSNLREASLGGVLLATTLSHLRDRESAVREVWRVLKEKGRAVVVEGYPAAQKSSLPSEEVKTLFEKVGFKYERTFDAEPHHYGLIFYK